MKQQAAGGCCGAATAGRIRAMCSISSPSSSCPTCCCRWGSSTRTPSGRRRGRLNVADKSDSQDICFIPDGDYVRFLRQHGAALTPGDFVDKDGHVLGRHKGLPCYTSGQRKGLGVAAGKHVYVVRKNGADNTILLGDDAELFTDTLTASRVNWIAGAAPAAPVRCTAKARYSQYADAPCTAYPLEGGGLRVVFDRPQRAITAGQAVVLYGGDEVLGGGTIESAE